MSLDCPENLFSCASYYLYRSLNDFMGDGVKPAAPTAQ